MIDINTWVVPKCVPQAKVNDFENKPTQCLISIQTVYTLRIDMHTCSKIKLYTGLSIEIPFKRKKKQGKYNWHGHLNGNAMAIFSQIIGLTKSRERMFGNAAYNHWIHEINEINKKNRIHWTFAQLLTFFHLFAFGASKIVTIWSQKWTHQQKKTYS